MAGPTLFTPSSIATGLQAHWKLDEGSGNRLNSSAANNTLVDTNTVQASSHTRWVRTGTNSAYFQRSLTEYFNLANASQVGLGFTSSYSICAWIRLASTGILHSILTKTDTNNGYEFSVNSSNFLRVMHNSTIYASSTALNSNTWYHVAVVYDDTNDRAMFYINGNLISVVAATTNPSSTTIDVKVGARNDLGGTYFDGNMHDLGAWSAVLTPVQIKSLALGVDITNDAYRPDKLTGLVSHWKLNEVGTNAARNDSKGGNTLGASVSLTNQAGAGFSEAHGIDLTSSNTECLRISDGAQGGLDITGNITLSAWIKLETDTTDQVIMSKAYPGGNQWAYYLYFRGSDTKVVRLLTSSNGVTNDGDCYSSVILKAGFWYHICATVSGTTMSMYVDGAYVGSGTSNGSIHNSSAYFMIGGYDGANNGTPSAPFNGLIQDAFVCNTAVSATDVKKLASCFPLQQAGLVSYWKLDEASGARADSVNGNTLSDVNSVGRQTNSRTGRYMASFNGTNQYLNISDGAQAGLEPAINFSVTFWQTPDVASGQRMILAKGNASTSGDYNWRNDGANNFIWEIGQTGGLNNPSVPTVTASRNYFGAGVWWGNGARIYVEDPTSGWRLGDEGINSKSGSFAGNSKMFSIGAETGPQYFYDGGIGDVTFWSRNLLDEEIKSIFAKNLTGEASDSDPDPLPPQSPGNRGNFMTFKM